MLQGRLSVCSRSDACTAELSTSSSYCTAALTQNMAVQLEACHAAASPQAETPV